MSLPFWVGCRVSLVKNVRYNAIARSQLFLERLSHVSARRAGDEMKASFSRAEASRTSQACPKDYCSLGLDAARNMLASCLA